MRELPGLLYLTFSTDQTLGQVIIILLEACSVLESKAFALCGASSATSTLRDEPLPTRHPHPHTAHHPRIEARASPGRAMPHQRK